MSAGSADAGALNLRIDPDDRIALLGRNGNGKTTLARLLAAQLAPMEGEMNASGKMKRRLFHPISGGGTRRRDTPLEHMTRQMKGATPGAVRAQLGRFGFSGARATTEGRQAVRRRARAAGARADHPRCAASADPRRADQPPRRRCARGAGAGAERRRWI
jgi:energy-coupling factor transporter ATP-binding protein EcfA2